MVHKCSICGKEMTREEYRAASHIGTSYDICPNCQKYFNEKDPSIPNFEKWSKLIEVSKRYEKERWFMGYLKEQADNIKNSMTEEEKAQADYLTEKAKTEAIDEHRSENAASFENKIKTEIVLVTTDFVTDHTIKHMLGPVSGCSAVGAGMIKSYFASWSATLGTKSNLFSEDISNTRRDAEEAMLKEAKALGANAVIDVHYTISNFATDLTGVLVTGTAVVIE